MRPLKFLTLFMVFLLVSVSLFSCDNEGEAESSDERKPIVLEPEITDPTIVPSPSLNSEDEIDEIGFVGNGMILSANKTKGTGVVFDGLTSGGMPLWKASQGDPWPIEPNAMVPDGFPTLVVPVGTEIKICNRTEYEIESDQYMDFSTGESYEIDSLPERAGIYIRVSTLNIPRPADGFEQIEKGAFFGEYRYFVVVSFE